MEHRLVLLASIVVIRAFAAEENVTMHHYAMGYVRQRQTSDDLVEVLNITETNKQTTPAHKDWHHAGQLTAIKNQGTCGSCWAMSTIEEVETAVMRHGDGLHHYSTEELVSCDPYDNGCGGGDPWRAVKYLESKGVATASDYPDHSSKNPHDTACRWNMKSVVKVTGHSYAIQPCSSSNCGHQSESALATAVASHGPMSICINAGIHEAGDWRNWRGPSAHGVMMKTCSANARMIDHCVQLIGYSKVYSTPYWRIRNSWGTDWGEKGFIRIPYGKGNRCCVACEAIHISAELKESRRRRSKGHEEVLV